MRLAKPVALGSRIMTYVSQNNHSQVVNDVLAAIVGHKNHLSAADLVEEVLKTVTHADEEQVAAAVFDLIESGEVEVTPDLYLAARQTA